MCWFISPITQIKTTGSYTFCLNKDVQYVTVDTVFIDFETALHNVVGIIIEMVKS